MQLGTEVLDLVLSFVFCELAEPLESLRTPGATVCSAAFASAALVRLAYSCDAIVCGAAESGCITRLSWLYTECNDHMPERICSYAARGGSIQMMERVVERGAVFGEATCDNAAKKGDLAMLKWLRQRHCPCDLPVVCSRER
eukprot:16515-Heterococcus_DN1.PRE.2